MQTAGRMISQFFVVSPRGDTLIFKDYRGDVPRSTSEVFWRKVKFSTGETEPVFVSLAMVPPPCFPFPFPPGSGFPPSQARRVYSWAPLCVAQCVEGVNYMHVKKSGLYMVITSRDNLSPCMILELLERLTRCTPTLPPLPQCVVVVPYS